MKKYLNNKIASIIAVISAVALIAGLSMSAFTTQAYVELQWPTSAIGGSETSIMHGPGDQEITKVIETDTSSRIVVWYEHNDQDGGSKVASIKAQKYDNTGAEEWAVGGVTIDTGGSEYNNPYFIPVFDGVGGVFVIFQRNHTSSSNILGAQVNSAGTLTAPVNLVIPQNGSESTLLSAIPDYSTGGFIYSYQGSTEANYGDTLLVQTANSSMVNQWNADTHVDCDSGGKTDPFCGTVAAYEYDLGAPYTDVGYGMYSYGTNPGIESLNMVKSGTNLLIVDKASGSWGTNDYILANSINLTTGVRAGVANILETLTYSSVASPKIVSDTTGGAYIVWRNYENNTYDYTKIDSSANAAACPGSASTFDTSVSSVQEQTIVIDGAGGFFAVYVTDSGVPVTPTRYLNVANVNCTGVESISTNTIKTIAPGGAAMINPRIVGDGSTGAFVTWLEGTSVYPSYSGILYGQHITSALTTTFATDFAITSTEKQTYSAQSFVKNSGTPGFVIAATLETAAPNADAVTESYGGRGLYDNYIISVDDPDLVSGGALEDFSWSPDTVSIVTPSSEDFEHSDTNQKSLKTAAGDYILAWTSRLGTVLTVRAQKYDTDGAGQWNGGSADGVVVGTYQNAAAVDLSYDIVMSGSDVLFLIAEGGRSTLKNNIAVKLSGTDGSIGAGPNTITNRADDRTAYIPQLIEDGSGGAFAIWGEQCTLDRNCDTTDPNNSNDTVVTHLTSSAAVDGSWNTAGGGVPLQIDSDTTSTPANTEDISTCTSRIIPDGAGGFIGLVLATNSSSGAVCNSFSTNYIIASRYSANGATTYDRNIVVSGPGTIYHFDAISDGSNGAILSYNQVGAGEYGTYSQRINGSGTELFPFGSADAATGQPIAAGYGGGDFMHKDSQIVSDESGTPNGAIITWNYTNINFSENSVLAQRIDSEGTKQWGDTGVPASPGDPYIVAAAQGDPGSCGTNTSFTQTDFGNEVDYITANVAITRGDDNRGISNGLYNPLVELAYVSTSPRNTGWYRGACMGDVTAFTYLPWINVIGGGGNPNASVGEDYCVHMLLDDTYYNVLMTSWSGTGDGFSYDRCEFTPGAAVLPYFSGTLGEGRDDSMQIENYDYFWSDETRPYTQSIAADGSGGAYIAYMSVVGGEEIVSAQNINSSGVRQFNEGGTYAESTTLGTDQYPIVMSGSIIVLWQNATGGLSDIYGQSLLDTPYGLPADDTIEIHTLFDGLPDQVGSGISNGDDSGTTNYTDVNWDHTSGTAPFLAVPPAAPYSINGANAFSFLTGEPVQSSKDLLFYTDPGTDVPASGGGILADQDDAYSEDIPLGFVVTMYGKDVDTVRITTDGFVYLNDSTDLSGTFSGTTTGRDMTDTVNEPFTSSVDGSATGDILIAGAWGRFDPGTDGTPTIQYFRDAPNELFYISYIGLKHFDSPNLVSTQIKIRGNGDSPCVALAGQTCASIAVGCNTGGAISISGISVTAPFETRNPEFYTDFTDAPLTSPIYVEITDTRGYDPNPPSCGVASTISVQSDGLVNGSDTLAVGLGTAIVPADWSCQGACSPANLSILSSESAVGPILTGTDILSLSEAFGGAFRLNLDDDNLEILRPVGPVGTGTYGGNITFTLT